MVSALRPGGWLLLEEVDFFPVHASENTDYRDFMTALVNTVVKASGRDCFWARALPRVVAEQGLSNVSGEGDFSLLQGGSEIAEFFTLTAEQMRETDAWNRHHRCGKNGSRAKPFVRTLFLGVWRRRGTYLGPASRRSASVRLTIGGKRCRCSPNKASGGERRERSRALDSIATLNCRDLRRPLHVDSRHRLDVSIAQIAVIRMFAWQWLNQLEADL